MPTNILDTVVEPTVADHQKAARVAIGTSIAQMRQTILAEYGKIRARIATDPNGLTPQQVLDGLDTAALSLFQLGLATDQYLDACVPGLSASVWAFPAGLTFTPEVIDDALTGRMLAVLNPE